jgi:hypothetical protein
MPQRMQPNVFSEKLMTPTEAAYFAGIIDGEGTIGLYRARRLASAGGVRIIPSVNIANTNLKLLERLREICGNGRLEVKDQRRVGNHKPLFGLTFKSNQIRHILPQVQPYLIAKAEQAEVMLSFLTTTRYGNNWKRDRVTGRMEANPLSSFDRTVHFADRLAELNRRGKAVNT